MVLYARKHDQIRRGIQGAAPSVMTDAAGHPGTREDRLMLVRAGFIWLLLAAVCGVALFCLYRYFYEPSQMRQARLHLTETAQSIKEYKIVHGTLPQKLEALGVRPDMPLQMANKPKTAAVVPARPRLQLSDPWGRPIVYRKKPSVALISTGPDGRPSDDDIIVNVNTEEENDTYSVQGKEESHETER